MRSKIFTEYIAAITESGLSIYDPIEIGTPKLWIPTPELETILNESMRGLSLKGLPLRTRSKVIKQEICKSLGYPIPSSFRKTKPRFPGQRFDTYGQKANNLQIWNEELEPNRRYVLIRISADSVVSCVKVVTGDELTILDTTGTLTQKYQARLIPGDVTCELISQSDSSRIADFPNIEHIEFPVNLNPTDHLDERYLLSIKVIFNCLKTLIGATFVDTGYDQERNRGAELHKLVCNKLGYSNYKDDGRFPDVRHQLLEVKLQTSPTIDLGLVTPDSIEPLDVPYLNDRQIRHCDVRYAIFYAATDGNQVSITHFFLTTGEKFFSRFPQFQGKVLNKKLQIPLPSDFFDR